MCVRVFVCVCDFKTSETQNVLCDCGIFVFLKGTNDDNIKDNHIN